MSAERIHRITEAFGKCLDRQKVLVADRDELEQIAAALALALTRGVGNHAALDAWEFYKERKQKK